MNTYRFRVSSTAGVIRIVIIKADSPELAITSFKTIHPTWEIISYEVIMPTEQTPKKKNSRSPAVLRGTYKARMSQVRNNLQSMIEEENPLLTKEEIVQLSRITCKLNHVISLFHVRTMDLKKEGKI